MEDHLNVHDPVVLRAEGGREYASRVENLGERLVVVAQPAGLPDEEVPGNGTEIEVAWADEDGAVTVQPTKILVAHAYDNVPVWSLVVTGPAYTEQRRRVERVDVVGPVVLRPHDGDERAAVPGTLADASEKAIRCSVGAGSADHFLRDRNQVIAQFRLGDAEFALPGRVEHVRATKNPTQFEDLVVIFDEPIAEADRLRKEVFAQQVRTPATGDEDERA